MLSPLRPKLGLSRAEKSTADLLGKAKKQNQFDMRFFCFVKFASYTIKIQTKMLWMLANKLAEYLWNKNTFHSAQPSSAQTWAELG